MRRTAFAAAMLCALLYVDAALAQTVTVPVTAIDLGTPIQQLLVGYLIPALGAIIMALGSWVLWKIKQKTGVQIDTSYLNILSEYATNKAGEILAKVDLSKVKVEVGHPLIAQAANDVIARIPETLAHFGISKENAAAWVQKFIVAKIGIIQPTDTAIAPAASAGSTLTPSARG